MVTKVTYTSRTTSGSIRVRSSCFSSLQQTPSARETLSHFELSGVESVVIEFVIGQTGGLVAFRPSSMRRGSATATAAVEGSDIEA